VPDQSFQHAATTPADVEKVWQALDLPASWEAIPGVDRVVDPIVDASGRLQGFSFESAVGGRRYNGRATPAGREAGRMVGWHISTSEITGLVSVGLAPESEGTRVEVRLAIEGVGMLGSLFFPVIASAIGSGFADAVEEFVSGLRA
jgi:carbon monoxide dehydrogenase subunit G